MRYAQHAIELLMENRNMDPFEAAFKQMHDVFQRKAELQKKAGEVAQEYMQSRKRLADTSEGLSLEHYALDRGLDRREAIGKELELHWVALEGFVHSVDRMMNFADEIIDVLVQYQQASDAYLLHAAHDDSKPLN